MLKKFLDDRAKYRGENRGYRHQCRSTHLWRRQPIFDLNTFKHAFSFLIAGNNQLASSADERDIAACF
jgi:hypothetical protein